MPNQLDIIKESTEELKKKDTENILCDKNKNNNVYNYMEKIRENKNKRNINVKHIEKPLINKQFNNKIENKVIEPNNLELKI